MLRYRLCFSNNKLPWFMHFLCTFSILSLSLSMLSVNAVTRCWLVFVFYSPHHFFCMYSHCTTVHRSRHDFHVIANELLPVECTWPRKILSVFLILIFEIVTNSRNDVINDYLICYNFYEPFHKLVIIHCAVCSLWFIGNNFKMIEINFKRFTNDANNSIKEIKTFRFFFS